MTMLKDLKLKDIIYQKELLTIIMSSSVENVYGQPLDSHIKRTWSNYKINKGQGEDFITGCLLDYDYIKNHYRLIAVDLRRQKKLDLDPKAIQQKEFVNQ